MIRVIFIMRLFLAVSFPPDTVTWMTEIQDGLRAHAIKGNFTRRENLHLTLHFLGEISNEKVGALCRIMDELAAPAFTLSLCGVGFFARERGDIWWVGLEHSIPLLSLQAELGKRLSAAGFNVEQRPYRPHLTLAREVALRDTAQRDSLCQIHDQRESPVTAFVLMKSERIGGILRYTPLHEKVLL